MTPSEPPPRASARRRLGIGGAIVIVLLVLAVTVGVGIVRGATAPTDAIPVRTELPSSVAAGTSAVIYVHVLGAVVAPGLYVLAEGARGVDAVAAAGGFTADAERGAINLARGLTDGEQIVVPVVGQVPDPASTGGGAAGGGASSGGVRGGKVNLNTADEAALDSLPRIGPALAQRILQWREQNGRFTSVDDLRAVPGIGDKLLEGLRDLVTV